MNNNIDLEKLSEEINQIQLQIEKEVKEKNKLKDNIIQENQENINDVPKQKSFEETVIEYVSKNNPVLYILTPCYGGLCYTTYTQCLLDTISLLIN